MSIGMELLTAAIHSLAFELLYRGVAVTLLSRWLCDRFYEAGAEEALALPAWLLMGDASINTPEAAQWSAATIMVLISTVSVLRKVSREGGCHPSYHFDGGGHPSHRFESSFWPSHHCPFHCCPLFGRRPTLFCNPLPLYL